MQENYISTPFGRAPMTLAMLATQMTANTSTSGKSADKWKLYRALCEARTRLGITDRALAILNALLSFSPKAELSEENGLVVFPSNAQLSLRANGMAEATIRRHLALLVKAGLLARKDSANGKRYARRDDEGAVNEAFGFSFAPLLARAEEIQAIAAEVSQERLAVQRLREHITICRRDVAKLLAAALEESATGDWMKIHEDFRGLVQAAPRNPSPEQLTELLSSLRTLREDVVNRLLVQQNTQNMNGNPAQIERHIQNSNPDSITEIEPAPEKKQGEMSSGERMPRREALKAFPLSMVLKACPEISLYGPGGVISNWRDMMSAAVVVRSMLGVSPSAYQTACEVMGPENAAVAMACILERGGQISSAGGYLRDLTRRAERGEFSLGPMLMALLRSSGIEQRTAS